MKTRLLVGFIVATMCLFGGNVQALTVSPSNDGAALVNTILGSGVTLVPGSVSYTGTADSSGTFADGMSSGIGIASGLLMTSGSVSNAPGPNNADNATTANGLPGNDLLNKLIPGFSTNEATVLTFSFETDTGDLFFNYVFASEEYNEYTNTQFNDVFGFFLDGVNIALIPGTATPVSINNVNGGNPFGVNATNPQFYNNNDPSDGGPFFNIQYDGFTDVFTASAIGIGAGTHEITLAIADAGDLILDSGVFIQGGTFSGTPTPTVPEPSSILLLSAGLAGLGFVRRKFRR